MKETKLSSDEIQRFFGIVGHITHPPVDLDNLKSSLEKVGLSLRFFRFTANPVYLVRRRTAARQGELRKTKEASPDE